MTRYQQMEVGVYDAVLGRLIVAGDPEWPNYTTWLGGGNAPDPAAAPTPPNAAAVALLRVERKLAVNQLRATKYGQGVAHLGRQWDSDEAARARVLEVITLFAAGVAWPAGFTWRDAADNDVPMTAVQFVGLLGKIRTATQATFDYAKQLKAQLDGAADPSSIDITQGWP